MTQRHRAAFGMVLIHDSVQFGRRSGPQRYAKISRGGAHAAAVGASLLLGAAVAEGLAVNRGSKGSGERCS